MKQTPQHARFLSTGLGISKRLESIPGVKYAVAKSAGRDEWDVTIGLSDWNRETRHEVYTVEQAMRSNMRTQSLYFRCVAAFDGRICPTCHGAGSVPEEAHDG